MTTALFDTVTGTVTATKPRPDVKTIRLLEGYGFRADAVRGWTPERAETALASCRKEEAIARRHADDVARQQEETVPRGQPTWMERMSAAECIEQAEAKGIEELSQCMSYSLYVLSDDETRRLSGYLKRLMRGQVATSRTEEVPE